MYKGPHDLLFSLRHTGLRQTGDAQDHLSHMQGQLSIKMPRVMMKGKKRIFSLKNNARHVASVESNQLKKVELCRV